MLAQPEYCFHKLPLNWISRHLAIKSLVADQLLFVFLNRKTLQKDLFSLNKWEDSPYSQEVLPVMGARPWISGHKEPESVLPFHIS